MFFCSARKYTLVEEHVFGVQAIDIDALYCDVAQGAGTP